MAQSDSEEFELVDSLDIAKQIVFEKKPSLAKIRSWLLPTNYAASSSEYRRHLSSRAPGTGEWIRQTSQFQQWHSSEDHGSIWIKAVPGAGKSVVAASMVDSLARKEAVPVLYFFFRQIIEANQNPRSLLRDWLAQLLPASEVLQVSLWELIEDGQVLDVISTDQLWKILLLALRNVEKAYCVVDALDEMDLDEDFLGRMNAMGSFRPAHVKVLMTSRPKQYLQRAMKDPQVIHVSLEEELVKRDISVLVQQRVSEFGNLSQRSKSSIRTTVCDRSQGLFLYARLMLDQTAQSIEEKQLDENTICQMVAKLPVGLEEMYNRMLFEHAAASQVNQEMQVLILQLVTQSARPLRLIEIAKAIEAIHGETGRDSKDVVRTACGSLLEIMEDEVVQILHHSFTEFLLDAGRLSAGTAQFPVIDPTIAHRDIAMTCLASLEGNGFRLYPDDNRAKEDYEKSDSSFHSDRFDFRSVFLQYPLLEYAARNWPYHAKRYDKNDAEFLVAVTHFSDMQKPQFRAWLGLVSRNYKQPIAARNATPLHVAASYGLSSWSEHLIKHGADVNATDSTQNTPIFWASRSGHALVVDLLLQEGAKPDVDGYDGLKPLHVAASRNNSEVVKLLLAARVSPTTPKTREVDRFCGNAPTSVGHSPLRYASMGGHTESVIEMIPYITVAEDLEDALCWAAQGGHSQLVAALLDNSSVSPNGRLQVQCESVSVTTGGQTPLILAAESLDPATVRILLDKGAEATKPSSRDIKKYRNPYSPRQPRHQGNTALHSLFKANIEKESESAAKEILTMLLASGADLEARDHEGNTPLLSIIGGWYSSGVSLISMNMLIAAGANPLAADNKGGTLLHKACETSFKTDAVKRLLELGANHSQRRFSDGATPLHSAVTNTHCSDSMIKLLTSHGAYVDVRDAQGHTPLSCAVKDSGMGKRQTVGALLDLKADVNLQNDLGQTCLHLFRFSTPSYEKSEDHFKNLINTGAKLELCDREGKTVLLHAITESDGDKVNALLQYSSPLLTARTYHEGKSALHLACHSRNPLKMIQMLVDHGADPTWVDNNGNTLLHEVATSFEGFAEDIALVKKLIDLGVPIRSLNWQMRTAWHILHPCNAANFSSRDKASRQAMFSVLLQHDPDVDLNAKDISGYTPLHLAAASSETQTFNLLQAGACISAKAFNLRTPLHCAARARKSNILAMLLDHANEAATSDQALDVDAKDKDGWTPLHDACRSGRPESVRILLDHGACAGQLYDRPASAFADSRSPLMACTEFVQEDKLWSCLRSGTAPLDEFRPIVFKSGHWQSSKEDKEQHDTVRIGPIASMLLETGARDQFALQAAVKAKSTALVAAFREKTPSTSQGFDETHLMFAVNNVTKVFDASKYKDLMESPTLYVSEVDEATLDEMIARGVDLAKDEFSGTALGVLAANGMTEKMIKVIDKAKIHDDSPSCKEIGKVRPLLHIACDRPIFNMEMVKLLVIKGHADVNACHQVKEKEGNRWRDIGNYIPGPTALHVLAKGNHWWQVEAIKFLVQNGADVDYVDDKCRTPLEYASSYIQHGSTTSQGFFRPQCCEMLLKLGANPNRLNPEGLVPLNMAGPDADLIRVLLRHGADVSAGTKGVLMSAVEAGDVDTLKLYLEHGADCNVADTSEDSSYENRNWKSGSISKRYPILKAAQPPSYSGWDSATAAKMISLLLKHGAKVDLLISDDDTLIHYLFQRVPTSILRPFLDRPGIDVNTRDQSGRTVFMAACESHVKDEGCSSSGLIPTEEQNRLRAEYIPAYMALADSELYGDSIDYLATDNEGKNVIRYLMSRWNEKVAARFLPITGVRALILQKDSAGFSPLHNALKSLKIETCLQFIDEGNADLLEPDPNGDSALHHLYRCRYMLSHQNMYPLMERYLSIGGDINARNKTGETALHCFLANSNWFPRMGESEADKKFDPFQFFISHSTNFQATKNDGGTALHVVAQRKTSDGSYFFHGSTEDEDTNASLFRRLVDLGCDPLQEDKNGRTALDVAAAVGNAGILKLYQRKKT